MPERTREPEAPPPAVAADPIFRAAFEVFAERGLAGATTLEIARRARISKRTLYQRFGSKEGIFAALVEGHSAEVQARAAQAEFATLAELEEALRSFGVQFLELATRPTALVIYRLVLADLAGSPELARRFDEAGRGSVVRAASGIFAAARRRGLLASEDPALPVRTFLALLSGDLLLRLVMGVAEVPSPGELRARAHHAASAVVQLFAPARSAQRARARR